MLFYYGYFQVNEWRQRGGGSLNQRLTNHITLNGTKSQSPIWWRDTSELQFSSSLQAVGTILSSWKRGLLRAVSLPRLASGHFLPVSTCTKDFWSFVSICGLNRLLDVWHFMVKEAMRMNASFAFLIVVSSQEHRTCCASWLELGFCHLLIVYLGAHNFTSLGLVCIHL